MRGDVDRRHGVLFQLDQVRLKAVCHGFAGALPTHNSLARLALRQQISVTDIGCGTGSNLRAMATLLPAQQSWTLVDYDAELLRVAREELAGWSDDASLEDETLCLRKGGFNIRVSFRQSDLNADLDGALGAGSDLITAAAFFDLASERFMRRFAQAVAARRAVFYTVLTYNGICRWQPHHHADLILT